MSQSRSEGPPARAESPKRPSGLVVQLPGLALSAALAGSAMLASAWLAFALSSPALLALAFGMAAAPLVDRNSALLRPGLAVAQRRLLRLAVVLLGLRLTLQDLAGTGLVDVSAALLTVVSVLLVGRLAQFLLGITPALGALLSVGTAICGASAIAAAAIVVRAREGDIAYALATITLLGTVGMVALPAISLSIGADPALFATWVGASLHEVAHVAGAAAVYGEGAAASALLVKMVRVALLVPVLLMVARWYRDRAVSTEARIIPPFVAAFLGVAALRSLGLVPETLVEPGLAIASFLLAAALGALGTGVRIRMLVGYGWRPFASAVMLAVVAVLASLVPFLFDR